MAEREARDGFGCGRCRPAGADDAWRARSALRRQAEPIDEPHAHVMILACGACGQRFVSVFSETVDWEGGEDPQYWALFPVTADEAAALSRGTGEAALAALASGRRTLRRDFPKGEEPRAYWGAGIPPLG